jgi:signal transduction histidine kinase
MNKRAKVSTAPTNGFLPDPGFYNSKTAARPDWTAMKAADHFVQFYESDEFLLDSLAGFIGAGLDAGDTCIVVATPKHARSLERRLSSSGRNINAAANADQYIFLDAAETLNSIVSKGYPKQERFAKVVGRLVARAAKRGQRVRIFGEMVALLWADKKQEAAIRLEEMWNGLGRTHAFSLFCAYPMKGLKGEEHTEPLEHVCNSHTHVIPAESYWGLGDEAARMREIAMLQQKAQSLEAEVAKSKRSFIMEQAARAEAERAGRLKDEFLAVVSHELRTPLNAIVGWANLLQKKVLDEETAKRAIDTIERSARIQAQMVEDMLDISRFNAGKLSVEFDLVDLASVISAAIDSVQAAAAAKDIILGVAIDPCARHANGDADRRQQIMWNLVSNGIKFTPSGGRVDIRVKRAGPELHIEVSDTGCGISPDFLPFIFDRFRQEDGSGTRRNGGLGLGLTIVRNIAELHGGTIEAESAGEGLGSTFTLRLPVSS